MYLKEDLEEEAKISNDQLHDTIAKRMPTSAQRILKQILMEEPTIFTWDLNGNRRTDVQSRYAFELADSTLACFPLHRVPAEHNAIMRKKLILC